MKKLVIVLVLLWLSLKIDGQNLVHNSSFEQYTLCPWSDGLITTLICPPWTGTETPDYFNSCATSSYAFVPNNIGGFQFASTGNAYTGIITFVPTFLGREYLIETLDSQLIANKYYCVNFYVSLSDSSSYAMTNIGIYFSDTMPNVPASSCFCNFVPQILNSASNMLSDKTNWMQVSGNFQAIGGENYIIIGNFNNDATTNVQHVSLASPAFDGAYYYVDDVSVVRCNVGVEELGIRNEELRIVPNPSSGVFEVKSQKLKVKRIEVFDIVGEKIITIENATSVDISEFAQGIYFIEITTNTGITRKKIVKK